MKRELRKLVAVVICILCTMSIVSCSTHENPFLVVDVSNDFQGVSVESDLSLTAYDNLANNNVQVTFDDRTYNCFYIKTYKRTNMSRSLMHYETNAGQVILLDTISGEFAGINFITPQYYLTQPYEQDVSQDELDAIKEKAIIELGKHIDLSKYEKEEYINDTYVDNKPPATPIVFYKVHYYKVINGFATTEEANIVYDSKGNIIEISIVDKGLFDGMSIANRVASIDKTKMNSDLDLKVETLCKSIDINEYTYEVEKTIVSTDNNGAPILLVYLNITYSDGLTGKIVLAKNI